MLIIIRKTIFVCILKTVEYLLADLPDGIVVKSEAPTILIRYGWDFDIHFKIDSVYVAICV